MTGARVAEYLMNPAEDMIVFGAQLADGMWVLPESALGRPGPEAGKDRQLRGQRFRKVTRLRREGSLTCFIGEWIDGYQEVHRYNVSHAWLVKKEAPEPDEAS